jgi:hypothetical protein
MLIKCSLHNHTILSDGALSPHELLHTLKDRGFKVITITDHNNWTLPHRLQIPKDIIFLNGVEWTFRYHIIKIELPLDINYRSLNWRDRIDLAKIDWLAHPGRWGLSIEKIKELVRAYKLDGVEKCNRNWYQYEGSIKGVVEYGVDDVHSIDMIGKNWIEIETDSFDKETIIEKLKKGDFIIKSRRSI